jgi:hypothetical protein
MRQSQTRLLLLASLAAIVALYLPWGWHQNASLSPNLHDLAEWITLSPQSQAQSPPLLGSLPLRGSTAMLAILVGMLVARHGSRFSRAGIVLGLVVSIGLALTLFPPLDFLSDSGNLNYRQQFLTAACALVGILGFIVVGKRFSVQVWNSLGLLVAFGAGLLAISGLILAQDMFLTLGVELSIGGGALGFVGLQCVQIGIYGWGLWSHAQSA